MLSECVRSRGQELNSFQGKTVQIHTAGWQKLGRTASYRCFEELRLIAEVHSYQSQCNSIHEYTQVASALGFRVVWSFECRVYGRKHIDLRCSSVSCCDVYQQWW